MLLISLPNVAPTCKRGAFGYRRDHAKRVTNACLTATLAAGGAAVPRNFCLFKLA
jgi:hypothetical protein